MRRLRRLLALPPAERGLLVKVVLLLGVVRLGLGLLPFRKVLDLLDRAARASAPCAEASAFMPDRIAWAVMLTSPYVLGVRPCLTQALVVQFLLGRQGYPARLHVGVVRTDWGQVKGHAWVEIGGNVVIGGSVSELARYTPLLALDPRTT
jgi:Transglutaminase-like superfamily